MKTKIYNEVQEEREDYKNSHGTFVRRTVERLVKDRGWRLESYESRPTKPNPNDLRYGRIHDALLRTAGGKMVGLELLNHIVADAATASDLREKALSTGCKLVVVATLQYTDSFVNYCTKHKIEAYTVASRSKLGHLKLKRVA